MTERPAEYKTAKASSPEAVVRVEHKALLDWLDAQTDGRARQAWQEWRACQQTRQRGTRYAQVLRLRELVDTAINRGAGAVLRLLERARDRCWTSIKQAWSDDPPLTSAPAEPEPRCWCPDFQSRREGSVVYKGALGSHWAVGRDEQEILGECPTWGPEPPGVSDDRQEQKEVKDGS